MKNIYIARYFTSFTLGQVNIRNVINKFIKFCNLEYLWKSKQRNQGKYIHTFVRHLVLNYFWIISLDANSYILSFRKNCWANFPIFYRENIIQTEVNSTRRFCHILTNFLHGISREWAKIFVPKLGPCIRRTR